MKIKKIFYAGITVVLLILLTISTGYANSIDDVNDIERKIPMDPLVSYKKHVDVLGNNNNFLKIPTDNPITHSIEDESNPNVVIDNKGNPFVIFDKNYGISENNLGVCYSPTGGTDWPDEYYYEYSNEDSFMTNPKITLLSDGIGAIGSYNDLISQTPDENFFITQDIKNPETWEFRYWDNSVSSDYILETSSTVTKEDVLCFATISDYDTGENYLIDCFSAHWHLQSDFEYIGGVIFYNSDYEDISQPLSHLTADAGDKVYFVAEQEMTDGMKIIKSYYCDVGETTQYTDWKSSTVARTTGNCTNPDISVSGPNAYCVYMDDQEGNQDIYIVKTTSGGFWRKYVVANTPDDEIYPVVTANGDEATCLFIKNNNVYVTKSEDAGKTWSDPTIVNDDEGTVIPEYGNLDAAASAGVWTANINDNNDLFYEEIGKAPVIVIDSIKGGFGISATISNVGNAPAEQIQWSIEINGTMILGSNIEGTIDIPMETSVSIHTNFILGIGQVEITVTVSDKSQSTNAFVLGPLIFLN